MENKQNVCKKVPENALRKIRDNVGQICDDADDAQDFDYYDLDIPEELDLEF